MPCLTFVRPDLFRRLSQRLLILLALTLLPALFENLPPPARAQSRNRVPRPPGQRAVVIDERLSALHEKPDVRAPLLQRLRRGRVVGIIKAGRQWHRVYITRHTRGWILAEAVARSGRADEAARLLKLAEGTEDDFVRARLARLCADEFRNTPAAPRALLLLAEAAEAAADRLTRDARRKTGEGGKSEAAENPRAGRREFMLSDSSLDRWNRAGMTFEYDAASDRIVYDGASYREIVRKYPRHEEARLARERLLKAVAGRQ
jgi:hypothetical protein